MHKGLVPRVKAKGNLVSFCAKRKKKAHLL